VKSAVYFCMPAIKLGVQLACIRYNAVASYLLEIFAPDRLIPCRLERAVQHVHRDLHAEPRATRHRRACSELHSPARFASRLDELRACREESAQFRRIRAAAVLNAVRTAPAEMRSSSNKSFTIAALPQLLSTAPRKASLMTSAEMLACLERARTMAAASVRPEFPQRLLALRNAAMTLSGDMCSFSSRTVASHLLECGVNSRRGHQLRIKQDVSDGRL
jgi:hypothetical protein